MYDRESRGWQGANAGDEEGNAASRRRRRGSRRIRRQPPPKRPPTPFAYLQPFRDGLTLRHSSPGLRRRPAWSLDFRFRLLLATRRAPVGEIQFCLSGKATLLPFLRRGSFVFNPFGVRIFPSICAFIC